MKRSLGPFSVEQVEGWLPTPGLQNHNLSTSMGHDLKGKKTSNPPTTTTCKLAVAEKHVPQLAEIPQLLGDGSCATHPTGEA